MLQSMRKQCNKILLAFVIAIVAFFAGVVGYTSDAVFASASSVPTWSQTDIQENYAYGETFAVPDVTLTVGEEEATAKHTLTYPSGNATVAKSVELEEAGLYRLEYSAKVGGKRYQKQVEFTVLEKAFYLKDSASSFWYGQHEYATQRAGLNVSLAQNDELLISQVIDLNGSTKNDPFFEGFVTPQIRGSADFLQLNIQLTDVENPENYIMLRGRHSASGQKANTSYWLAGGNGQIKQGLENGKVHKEDQWGTPYTHSFFGVISGDKPLDSHYTWTISLRYDDLEKAIYLHEKKVMDFDDPAYYDYLWSGFESGKVRMTVSADSYNGSLANFCITYAKDVDLSLDTLVDNQAPNIKVDTKYDIAPKAKVGLAYPIPQASAWDDFSGECEVSTSVWYNVTAQNGVNVQITNGTFVPKKAGNYAIAYTSIDKFGNKTEKVVPVQAVTALENIEIEPKNSDFVTQGTVGDYVEIAEVEVNGGSGNTQLQTKVKFGNEEIFFRKGFQVTKIGTYVVEYVATDYLGQQKTYSYEIVVAGSEEPVVLEKPELPKYFISGSEYTIPDFYVYDYTSGQAVAVKAALKVTDANGERTVTGSFIPLVNNTNEKVKITYTVGGTVVFEEEIVAIKPYEQGESYLKLNLQNYFVVNGATTTASVNAIEIVATQENGSWEFAKPQLAEGLVVNFEANTNKSFFSGLQITLIDSKDSTIAVTARLQVLGNKTVVSVGENSMECDFGFFTESKTNVFSCKYANGHVKIGGVAFKVETTDENEIFPGFTSNSVYVKVQFVGASVGAGYKVTSINDQQMSTISADRVTPRIYLIGNYGGVAKIGEEITVPKIWVNDVLDPNTSVSLLVTDPNGNVVTSMDGVLLNLQNPDKEYKVQVTYSGQYLVKFTVADTFNEKENVFTFAVNILDEVAPEVYLIGKISESVKLGSKIVIPEIKTEDNSDGVVKVVTYVYTPNGRMVEIPEKSNAFQPTYVGTYQIRIVAYDESGNMNMLSFNVHVS